MADPLACTDLLAHRRYAYAQAAAEDGDFAAAAEILEQALERAPAWPPALFALAEAREKLGDKSGAAAAYRRTLAADPSDTQGAGARLALLGAASAPPTLSQAYVARLFDDYAPRFEAHVTEKLAYRGPQALLAALDAAAPRRAFPEALDLGCGSGLMGAALRGRVSRLSGVDISPAMVAKAREGGLYDALAIGEAVGFLAGGAPERYDLVAAADVLVYLGDLAPLFAAAAGALKADGLIAFTLEALDGDGFALRSTMRFAHARTYVEAAAGANGLVPRLVRAATTRSEAGVEVLGLVCVFAPAQR